MKTAGVALVLCLNIGTGDLLIILCYLIGTIPESIGKLSSLKSLDLFGNLALTGQNHAELSCLTVIVNSSEFNP